MKTGRTERGAAMRSERLLQLDLRELELATGAFAKRVRRRSEFMRFVWLGFVLELQARAGAPIAPAPAWFAFLAKEKPAT